MPTDNRKNINGYSNAVDHKSLDAKDRFLQLLAQFLAEAHARHHSEAIITSEKNKKELENRPEQT